MELQFLGTGAGVPAKMRNVSSIALKLLDERNEIWLFDCGEATQQQILNTTIRPGKLKNIYYPSSWRSYFWVARLINESIIPRWRR